MNTNITKEVFMIMNIQKHRILGVKRLGYFDGHDISGCESKIVETEKVLGALLRSMCKN